MVPARSDALIARYRMSFGRRKPRQEFLTFVATNRQPVRQPFNRCSVSRTIEFYVVSDWVQTVGDLVDAAVGACPALCDAGLLHPADVGRLCAMLHDFGTFPFKTPDGPDERPAAALDVKWMRRASKAWVQLLFREGERLLPLFATEAAYFLEAVAYGARCEYPRNASWHLDGRLGDAQPHDEAIHRDKRWKKDFTESLMAVTLLARAPEDLELQMRLSRKTLPAGTDFKFIVWRSPLSEGFTDRVAFLYSRPELLRETWPYGAIVLDEDDNPVGRDTPDGLNKSHIEGVIPWRWIVEYVDRREESPGWKPVPQLEWKIGT